MKSKRYLRPVFLALFAVVAAYLFFIASDQYVSEAKFIIQKDKESDIPGLDLGVIAAVTGTSTSNYDSLLLENYIQSMGMLAYLQDNLDIKSHYADDSIDFYSRINEGESFESFYEYYLDHIEIEVESLSSVVTVRAKAFTADMAQKVTQQILEKSEMFVNEIGQSLGREQVEFMQQEVREAEENVNAANEKLMRIQNKYELLTPEAEAATLIEIIGVLESELALQKTELKRLQSFLNPKAPEVVALTARIRALESQIRLERRKQTNQGNSGGEGEALNFATIEYQRAQQDLLFAQSIHQSTLKSLENARLDASKKVKYLVVLSPANLPEEALYPRKLYILATLAIVLLILYGIVRLSIATIEDHRD